MKLRILQNINSEHRQAYRGTDRMTPFYCERLAPDDEPNRLFFWYCSEGGELGVVHNFEKAKELVTVYRHLDPPQDFEIVEVVTGNSSPQSTGEFLGFDLSAGYSFSLLSWGLDLDQKLSQELLDDNARQVLFPLLLLIKSFFQPQLNNNGLFNDYDTANFCLACMMALQKIYPGLWENEQVEFEVIGLWKL